LKILLLNYTDNGGGAAIAAFHLFDALREYGIDAYLGVIEKKSVNTSVIALSKKKKITDSSKLIRLFRKFFKKSIVYLRKIFSFEFRTSNLILHSKNKKSLIDIDFINNSDYDLIHLHWINNDMISIEDIKKIKKPIVWTMHDSWVFCGAEHHPNILEDDERFIKGYTRKNKPKSTIGTDICRKTWNRKVKAWRDCRFNFIAPSNFEKDALQESALFHHIDCTVIPNIIPDNIFRPVDRKILRNIYQIPVYKKIIGFGAANHLTNKKSIKGEYLLLDMLQKIDKPDNYHLIIFGTVGNSFVEKINLPIFATGFISNPYILAGFYNVCDVVVCPSILENLPNVCLESLFCGVPVTAFKTGGIPDIVEHKKTGYLAEPFDTNDLYQGVLYCIDNYAELSANSLSKAHADFNAETIVRKHLELYKKVLNAQEKPSS
jgi:glycosyltransferase involved in cell wall biosynthesis